MTLMLLPDLAIDKNVIQVGLAEIVEEVLHTLHHGLGLGWVLG